MSLECTVELGASAPSALRAERTMTDGLSAYELKRLETIRKNQEMMIAMGLDVAISSVRAPAKPAPAKKAPWLALTATASPSATLHTGAVCSVKTERTWPVLIDHSRTVGFFMPPSPLSNRSPCKASPFTSRSQPERVFTHSPDLSDHSLMTPSSLAPLATQSPCTATLLTSLEWPVSVRESAPLPEKTQTLRPSPSAPILDTVRRRCHRLTSA